MAVTDASDALISLAPTSMNLTGNRYALGAILLGSALLVLTVWFAYARTSRAARAR